MAYMTYTTPGARKQKAKKHGGTPTPPRSNARELSSTERLLKLFIFLENSKRHPVLIFIFLEKI
jgi:hypothetical protein